MKKKGRLSLKGRLPRSREEALANPVHIVRLHLGKNGDFDPERGIGWIEVNRPTSLQYDLGIDIYAPTVSGELQLDAD